MTVLPFPERPVLTSDTGGSGSADPTIESRARNLEQKIDNIKATLQRIELKMKQIELTSAKAKDLQKIQIDLAEVKGRISALPTRWMLMVTVLSTWTVGAGTVFTLVKATHP